MMSKKTPEKSRYPVHYLVWHNKHRQLEKELSSKGQVRASFVHHTHTPGSSSSGIYVKLLFLWLQTRARRCLTSLASDFKAQISGTRGHTEEKGHFKEINLSLFLSMCMESSFLEKCT